MGAARHVRRPEARGLAGAARLPATPTTRGCSGCTASASTGPRTSARRWDEALAAGRPALIEVDHRPRGPAAAAAHPLRAGQGLAKAILAGRSRDAARSSRESLQGQARGVPDTDERRSTGAPPHRCANFRRGRRAEAAGAARRRPARCRSALEIYVEHYSGSFGNKWMWTPVALSPPLSAAGIAGVRSRARGAGPSCRPSSALYCLDGAIGVYIHLRGRRASPAASARPPTTSSWARRCWRPARWRWSARWGWPRRCAPGALMAARRSSGAGHLPKRGDGPPDPPPSCRASAAGPRRRCTAATRTTTCSRRRATGTR